MFEWIKDKARKVRDWAEEHPFLAATVAAVVGVGTGGIIYLVYQNLNGYQEMVALLDSRLTKADSDGLEMPTVASFDFPDLEPEPEHEPMGADPEANAGEYDPLDLWDEDEIVIVLIDNMETLDSEVFEKLYDRLDVDHQIEVDDSIREFANNAVGCDYWDSDD